MRACVRVCAHASPTPEEDMSVYVQQVMDILMMVLAKTAVSSTFFSSKLTTASLQYAGFCTVKFYRSGRQLILESFVLQQSSCVPGAA